MLLAITISLIIIWALGYAMRTEYSGSLIEQHHYNRYSDAPAARQDHLG
jgi:hypothetical protein